MDFMHLMNKYTFQLLTFLQQALVIILQDVRCTQCWVSSAVSELNVVYGNRCLKYWRWGVEYKVGILLCNDVITCMVILCNFVI